MTATTEAPSVPPFDPKMTAAMRVHCIRQKVEYLKKTKEVTGQSYKAVTHDQVTDYIRDALIEYHLLIVPTLTPGSAKVVPTGTFTSKQVPFIRFEAEYDVAFVSVHDKADLVFMHVAAHAVDQGDKAPGKALSYATKAAELKMFNIVTGEEDDEQRPGDEKGGISGNQEAEWRKQIDQCKTAQDAQKLWESEIVPACQRAEDRSSYTRMRGHITAKLTALKQASTGAAKPAAQKKAA